MRRKILTTALLSMTLLSLNLSAGSKMKCNGGFCIVDLSANGSKAHKVKSQQPQIKRVAFKKVPLVNPAYNTVLIDNIETIVFSEERYIMTEAEIGKYESEKPAISDEGLPVSKHFCEDDLKPVKVAGIANTFECA